jgi:hypothetical protein
VKSDGSRAVVFLNNLNRIASIRAKKLYKKKHDPGPTPRKTSQHQHQTPATPDTSNTRHQQLPTPGWGAPRSSLGAFSFDPFVLGPFWIYPIDTHVRVYYVSIGPLHCSDSAMPGQNPHARKVSSIFFTTRAEGSVPLKQITAIPDPRRAAVEAVVLYLMSASSRLHLRQEYCHRLIKKLGG